MDPLFEPVPDFDQPIAVLKHCHDRIRKQIRIMQKLLPHLAAHGADDQARQAAKGVLRYFELAAPKHHADEEVDLIPMLQASATGEDLTLLSTVVPQILHEHRLMESAWTTLQPQLESIANGESSALASDDVSRFADLYSGHMEIEEANVAPMAKRIFSVEQMRQLGEAMRARRGITP
ncbi:hemerythrin domain-containing protein [soil metagenome]